MEALTGCVMVAVLGGLQAPMGERPSVSPALRANP